jgi:hypothetical protein
MAPSVLAVALRRLGFTKDVGGRGSLAVGPRGALMSGGRTLVPPTTPGTLVIVFTIIGHRRL